MMLNYRPANWNYLIVWEFLVRSESEQRFEQAYGPHGRWAELFKQSDGYVGTELNHDLNNPRRYVTLDFWVSREAYENFRKARLAEYEAIDRGCEDLTEHEVEIGSFERMAR